MTQIAGSGSISQRHGSPDPDRHQNVMDPEHCSKQYLNLNEKKEAKISVMYLDSDSVCVCRSILYSDVKPTFFQDRLLSFSCKCPKKNRINSFLKQNSLSERNILFQISKFLVQKQLVCSVSKFFLRLQEVLFCF
jgi:hypothetical protein